jgi:hypothetical protein
MCMCVCIIIGMLYSIYMKLLQMSSLVSMLVISVYTLSRIPPFQSKNYFDTVNWSEL